MGCNWCVSICNRKAVCLRPHSDTDPSYSKGSIIIKSRDSQSYRMYIPTVGEKIKRDKNDWKERIIRIWLKRVEQRRYQKRQKDEREHEKSYKRMY